MRFLFGSETGLLRHDTREDARALRRYGALQLAHGGTLVLRHAEELPQPVQECLWPIRCSPAATAACPILRRGWS